MKTKKVGNYILQFVFAILGLASCLIFYSFKINYFDLEADKIALILSLVFLSFIVLIEFVSMFIIYDSTYHTFVSSFFILLGYLFSPDVIDIVYYGVEIAPIIQYVISSVHFLLFLASVFFTLNFIDFRYKIFVGFFNKMIVLLFSLGCFILYCVLNYFGYGIFGLAIYAIATMLFCINNQRKITDDDFIFYVCENIVFALLGMELFFQIADILKVETYGVGLFYAFSIVILYISIYVYFIFSNVKRALKSYEYEKELKELESEVLMKQINPHFLFNCLNAVQNIYHENLEQGDNFLNLFSKYLRNHVSHFRKPLISFEEELDGIDGFVRLEEMKRSIHYNVEYDVEFMDFYVPPFSLQVFVENSIKYARTESKEDGEIVISTRSSNENIIVIIKDNGVGFDPKAIKNLSCGMMNVKRRLELSLSAKVLINSVIGTGTTITILIPITETNSLSFKEGLKG